MRKGSLIGRMLRVQRLSPAGNVVQITKRLHAKKIGSTPRLINMNDYSLPYQGAALSRNTISNRAGKARGNSSP